MTRGDTASLTNASQSEGGRPCECGCGELVYGLRDTGPRKGQPRRFINHHNTRVQGPKSLETRAKLAVGQRKAWDTKRQRRPLGATRPNVHGYLLMKVGQGAKEWREQHIVLIEEQIGRPLREGEHVHHINAIRSDNALDNLHLFASSSEHAQAHGSLNQLLKSLLDEGLIEFDRTTGRYRRP